MGDGSIVLGHCADLRLEPDEQVTFKTESGTELDVARKDWGYYATPSLNRRLPAHGLRAALVLGDNGKAFLHLVEQGRERDHADYLEHERMWIVAWLDTDAAVTEAARNLGAAGSAASPGESGG